MNTLGNGFFRIDCNVKSGTWNIFSKMLKEKSLTDVSSYAEINGVKKFSSDCEMKHRVVCDELKDPLGSGRQLRLFSESACGQVGIETFFRLYGNEPFLLMGLKITNLGNAVLNIGKVSPLFIKSGHKPCLDLGGNFDNYKIFVDSGSSKTLVRQLNYDALCQRYEREMGYAAQWDWVEADNQHRSVGPCVIFNPETSRGINLSFLTFKRARSETKVEYSQKRVEWLAAECEFANYRVLAGHAIQSELLWFSEFDNPLTSLEEYAQAVKGYNRIRIKHVPVGWCSWYPHTFRDMISETKILDNARAIKKCFSGFGVRWIQVDYGWFAKNLPGEYEKTNERFPRGIPWLRKRMAKLGFEMGLWFCPGLVTENSTIFRKHPDCVLHDRNGRPAPRHLSPWAWKPGGMTYDLDPTHPAARAFIRKTMERAASKWGVTYFKNDFLEQTSRRFVEHWDKKIVKGIETYRCLLKIIKEAVGEHAFIFGCSNLSNGSLGLIDSTKTAPDIGAGKEHRCPFGPYGHLRTTIRTIASRWFQNGTFWINDPDVIIFENCPPEERKIRVTVVALSGGTVMLGDDMRRVVKDKKLVSLYKMCLPPYGKAARPVDLFENDYPQIWDLCVEKEFGCWHVVALFNFEAKGIEVTVDFGKLGLEKGRKYLVWEFWQQRLMGVFSEQVKVHLESVTTKLLLIKAMPAEPAILSTDMHLTQGGVELVSVKWDDKKRELSGICQRPAGEHGTLFLYCPEPYRVKQSCAGGRAASILQVDKQISAMPLTFKGPVAWNVLFNRR